MGAPEKFDTPEKRRAVWDAWKLHRQSGLSGNSFPLASQEVVVDMVNKYPQEFDRDEIAKVEREYMKKWEEMGIDGMMGKNPYFQGSPWIFNMKNRFKWSDRIFSGAEGDDPFEVKVKLVE